MRKQRVTACDNFFSSDKEVRCNGRYCDACIQRHYLEDPGEFSNLSSWICYRCTGRCTCAACKRRRKADEEGDDDHRDGRDDEDADVGSWSRSCSDSGSDVSSSSYTAMSSW